MTKIDLIECWPKHTDFPLHRKFLHENRSRFNKVIIVLTDMGVAEPDYTAFIKEQLLLDNITFIEMPRVDSDKDWRNEAVNAALKVSDGRWIWFTEPDFFITKPDKFWELVSDFMEAGDSNAIGYLQDGRMHPCCLFVERFILDNFTRKDFGIIKDKADHFSMIQQDLEKAAQAGTIILNELYKAQKYDWCYHMNGLSQNMYLLQSGGEPNYYPEEFRAYLEDCLQSGVPLLSEFVEIADAYLWKK